MTIAIFVSIWSKKTSSKELKAHLADKPLSFFSNQSDVECVEFYVPETGNVPVMDDVPPAKVIVQIDLETADKAQALATADVFTTLLLDKNAYPGSIEKINLDILEVVHYDLPGHDTPPPRTASTSFVVRYYGPVANGREFVEKYTSEHPPLLAKFPDIRNVICYLPLDWQTSGQVTDERTAIGNEVVFDNLDGLNQALVSDAVEAVVADGKAFKEYGYGYNSHHAMHRECVYKR